MPKPFLVVGMSYTTHVQLNAYFIFVEFCFNVIKTMLTIFVLTQLCSLYNILKNMFVFGATAPSGPGPPHSRGF
jgi:hypothetical protein